MRVNVPRLLLALVVAFIFLSALYMWQGTIAPIGYGVAGLIAIIIYYYRSLREPVEDGREDPLEVYRQIRTTDLGMKLKLPDIRLVNLSDRDFYFNRFGELAIDIPIDGSVKRRTIIADGKITCPHKSRVIAQVTGEFNRGDMRRYSVAKYAKNPTPINQQIMNRLTGKNTQAQQAQAERERQQSFDEESRREEEE